MTRTREIPVVQAILSANEQVAEENRRTLARHQVFAVNVMASPGAGKTSLILATARHLPANVRLGVVEGDVASRIDAETIAAAGIPVVQVNTGGACHLDAPMIRSALTHLPLETVDLLFVENVGNLICPAEFALGTHLNVVVASVPEGHDKPYKYPGVFTRSHAVVLNKADMIDVFAFDLDAFRRGVAMVNPHAPVFVLSCKTDMGVPEWVRWLLAQKEAVHPSTTP